MKLQEITQEQFDQELRQLTEDEKMLGQIGIGKTEALSLFRANRQVLDNLLLSFIRNSLQTGELLTRAERGSPNDMMAVLAEQPTYIDLPVKLFLLGMRLGQKESC